MQSFTSPATSTPSFTHVCHCYVNLCPDSIGTKLGGKPGSKPGGKKPFKPYNKDKKSRPVKGRTENKFPFSKGGTGPRKRKLPVKDEEEGEKTLTCHYLFH